jgi:hypothetical protein
MGEAMPIVFHGWAKLVRWRLNRRNGLESSGFKAEAPIVPPISPGATKIVPHQFWPPRLRRLASFPKKQLPPMIVQMLPIKRKQGEEYRFPVTILLGRLLYCLGEILRRRLSASCHADELSSHMLHSDLTSDSEIVPRSVDSRSEIAPLPKLCVDRRGSRRQ